MLDPVSVCNHKMDGGPNRLSPELGSLTWPEWANALLTFFCILPHISKISDMNACTESTAFINSVIPGFQSSLFQMCQTFCQAGWNDSQWYLTQPRASPFVFLLAVNEHAHANEVALVPTSRGQLFRLRYISLCSITCAKANFAG